jgi:5-methylcytosine-specific restriction endonuclease McrA
MGAPDLPARLSGMRPSGRFFRPPLLSKINTYATTKETVMQKRYCTCGRTIWVNYYHTNQGWIPQLNRHAHPQETLRICPNCGRILDINRLP